MPEYLPTYIDHSAPFILYLFKVGDRTILIYLKLNYKHLGNGSTHFWNGCSGGVNISLPSFTDLFKGYLSGRILDSGIVEKPKRQKIRITSTLSFSEMETYIKT